VASPRASHVWSGRARGPAHCGLRGPYGERPLWAGPPRPALRRGPRRPAHISVARAFQPVRLVMHFTPRPSPLTPQDGGTSVRKPGLRAYQGAIGLCRASCTAIGPQAPTSSNPTGGFPSWSQASQPVGCAPGGHLGDHSRLASKPLTNAPPIASSCPQWGEGGCVGHGLPVADAFSLLPFPLCVLCVSAVPTSPRPLCVLCASVVKSLRRGARRPAYRLWATPPVAPAGARPGPQMPGGSGPAFHPVARTLAGWFSPGACGWMPSS